MKTILILLAVLISGCYTAADREHYEALEQQADKATYAALGCQHNCVPLIITALRAKSEASAAAKRVPWITPGYAYSSETFIALNPH